MAVLILPALTDNSSSAELSASEISVIPSSYQVEPGTTFTIDINIDPVTPVSGVQFDLSLPSSDFSVISVNEGDLFSQSGATVAFELKNAPSSTSSGTIYSAVLGNLSATETGTVAEMTVVAGDKTGFFDIGLTNVIMSDSSSHSMGFVSNSATILVDSKPVLTNPGLVQVKENDQLDLTLQAADSDNDVLTFSATSLTDGASFNSSTGNLLWIPDASQVGEHSVEVAVTDGYLNDTMILTIEVLPSDLAPVADASGPYTTRVGKKIKLTGTDSYDPDGTIMSYTWDFGDGSTAVGATAFHTYTKTGVYTVKLTVMDNAGNTGTDVTTLTAESFFKYYLG
ncbi:PKD domain-containing protein [Methanolobus sediminis]|uniref:PKD domain-containing protein n=1 Tax=Methanolobus sediminis TaxID=3072978 RepID=A0AA51UK26_9EURY|nr:PKD domain-containing protein [Methanolobus sediminis]WMW24999.1 PKD domain-containing protein [Methanolobus sediminis]